MAFELGHTSTSRGLDTGTSGYTTVVRTTGMPNDLRRLLEKMSAYVEDGTPPMPICGIRSARISGRTIHVASLIRPRGEDHSGRANRLAWHLAFSTEEMGTFEPAEAIRWLLRRSDAWDGTNATPHPPEKGFLNFTDRIQNASDPDTEGPLSDEWRRALADTCTEQATRAIVVPADTDLIKTVIEILDVMPKGAKAHPTICAGTAGTDRDLHSALILVSEDTKAQQRITAGAGRELIDLTTPAPKTYPSEDTNDPAGLDDQVTKRQTPSKAALQPKKSSHEYLFDEPETKPEQRTRTETTPETAEPMTEDFRLESDGTRHSRKALLVLCGITLAALVILVFLIFTYASKTS